jgi:hypothetical protein
MLSFVNFLQSECPSIQAFVDEVCNDRISAELIEEENSTETDILSRLDPIAQMQVEEFLQCKNSIEQHSVSNCASESDGGYRSSSLELHLWSRSVRLAVLDHLITFDINISLLIEEVQSYSFDLVVEQLVELVRTFDILGAEKRLREYEAILNFKFNNATSIDRIHWKYQYRKKLPISFYERMKYFDHKVRWRQSICEIGSQRLLEYFSDRNLLDNVITFGFLCRFGYLELAQWFCNRESIDIHACEDHAFSSACAEGRIAVAKWLYSFGNINISKHIAAFVRSACYSGSLELAQWLYSLTTNYIYYDINYTFQIACEKGNLHIAQWVYSLGGVNIHSGNDMAFQDACVNGHLPVAQWLYSLGGIDVHVNSENLVILVVLKLFDGCIV